MSDTYLDCPRAKSAMTPCVARDGRLACADDGLCVGCGVHPADELRVVVKRYVDLLGRQAEVVST